MDVPPEVISLVVDFPVLEAEMSITVISGIAYGLVFSLYLSCFRGLLQGKKKSSLRRRLFLTYITCMLFASTGGIVQNMTKMIGDVLSLRKLANGGFFGIPRAGYFSSSTLAYILAIWGADSLLAWRCVALYQDLSTLARRVLIFSLAFVLVVSLLAGFTTLIIFQLQILLAIMAISASINLVLSGLIVYRIHSFQVRTRTALGDAHGPLYDRIIIMCVESCALIVVFEFACIIGFFASPNYVFEFAFTLLPQICGISSLLVIKRVTQGIDSVTIMDTSGTDYGRDGIQFAHGVSESTQED